MFVNITVRHVGTNIVKAHLLTETIEMMTPNLIMQVLFLFLFLSSLLQTADSDVTDAFFGVIVDNSLFSLVSTTSSFASVTPFSLHF